MNWDNILEEVYRDVQERNIDARDFAYGVRDDIKTLAGDLKFNQNIYVEAIDATDQRGGGAIIYPRKLFVEPNDNSDGIMGILEEVGEEISLENYHRLLREMKGQIMEKLGILDENNIPEDILERFKEILYSLFNNLRLGSPIIYFDKVDENLININGEPVDIAKILPGDLIFRVAREGFVGSAIYISSESIKSIDEEDLIKQIRIQIGRANERLYKEINE